MTKHKTTIFLSYSWKDEKEANAIDNRLKLISSLNIKRDIRDVKAFGNIKAFMEQIKDQDYALVLISDHFLKSENCMYEISKLFKSKKLKDKIIPIRINEVKIFSREDKKRYADYWSNEVKKVKKDIQDEVKKDRRVPTHYYDQKKQYEKIAEDIQSILNYIQSIKLPSFEDLEKYDYKTLLEHIGITEDNESIAEAMSILDIQDRQQQDIAIEELQVKYPKNAIVYMLKAQVAYQREEFHKIIYALDKAIELDPNDAVAYNNRGAAKADLKQHKEAIKDYTKAIDLDPNYVEVYYNRGNTKAGLKQYEAAIKDLNKAIKLNPNYTKAYNNRGNAKAGLKQHKEALDDYNKAIELDPKFAMAYYNRGLAKDDLKQYKEALEDYNKAIELDPKFAMAYYNRGNTKAGLKQYEAAIKDYTKAIELDPNDAEAYNNRGAAKVDLGRQATDEDERKQYFEEALEDYNKALELDPKLAEAYNNRGNAKRKLEQYDYDKALDDYNKAIEIDPDYAMAYNNRGATKLSLGVQATDKEDKKKYFKEAIDDFNQALVIDPNYQNAIKGKEMAEQFLQDLTQPLNQ